MHEATLSSHCVARVPSEVPAGRPSGTSTSSSCGMVMRKSPTVVAYVEGYGAAKATSAGVPSAAHVCDIAGICAGPDSSSSLTQNGNRGIRRNHSSSGVYVMLCRTCKKDGLPCEGGCGMCALHIGACGTRKVGQAYLCQSSTTRVAQDL